MNRARAEFGDVQTPLPLARMVCALLARMDFRPASILEPTCGAGAFLMAALETFADVRHACGYDINPQHVAHAQMDLERAFPDRAVAIQQSDFFRTDWDAIVSRLPDPVLFIGNPPWATNAALSAMESSNLPVKANHDRLRGIEAITGRSNFDIAESIINRLIALVEGRPRMLAMLCKTSTARRSLWRAWRRNLRIEASVHRFDAQAWFGVAVDACVLTVRGSAAHSAQECAVFRSFDAERPDSIVGLLDDLLIADVARFLPWRSLVGDGRRYWRSGVKHDCQDVFELRMERGALVNGCGETVDIEPHAIYPLLKSSDLAARRQASRWIVAPQRSLTDDPERWRLESPKAWQYLNRYAPLLDQRKSSVYRRLPRFALFGIGAYSFAPWKLAISGFAKRLEFSCVGPREGRPTLLDDACVFLPCPSEEACQLLFQLATSSPAQSLWSSLIFWDAKRPITAQVLNALDMIALARRFPNEEDRVRAIVALQWLDRMGKTHNDGIADSVFREGDSFRRS